MWPKLCGHQQVVDNTLDSLAPSTARSVAEPLGRNPGHRSVGFYVVATEAFSASVWNDSHASVGVSRLSPRGFANSHHIFYTTTRLGTALQWEQVRTSVQRKRVSGHDGFMAGIFFLLFLGCTIPFPHLPNPGKRNDVILRSCVTVCYEASLTIGMIKRCL